LVVLGGVEAHVAGVVAEQWIALCMLFVGRYGSVDGFGWAHAHGETACAIFLQYDTRQNNAMWNLTPAINTL